MSVAEKLQQKNNPANPAGASLSEKRRIPMSVPVQRLQVDEIPGYHLHWMRNTPDRLAQAARAGYEFVGENEIYVNATGVGSSTEQGGNDDMGTRVSRISGDGIGNDGQPEMLILMKIREEWYQESVKILEERNDSIAAALRGGDLGMDGSHGDPSNRYIDKARTKIPDLFIPKRS